MVSAGQDFPAAGSRSSLAFCASRNSCSMGNFLTLLCNSSITASGPMSRCRGCWGGDSTSFPGPALLKDSSEELSKDKFSSALETGPRDTA